MNVKLKSLSISGTRDFVRGFFKEFPQHLDHKPKQPGSFSEFTKIIKQFHDDFTDAVVQNRDGAELPLKMGKVFVVAFKSKKSPVNFSNYKTKGEISNHTNNHTDGWVAKIVYSNHDNKYRLKDKCIWELKRDVAFKKKVSEHFSKNYMMYMISPDKRKIFYDDLECIIRDEKNARIERFLKNYDEFNVN